MFIVNEDNTITVKCDDGEFRTFNLKEIDFEEYIKTGEVETNLEYQKSKSDFKNFEQID